MMATSVMTKSATTWKRLNQLSRTGLVSSWSLYSVMAGEHRSLPRAAKISCEEPRAAVPGRRVERRAAALPCGFAGALPEQKGHWAAALRALEQAQSLAVPAPVSVFAPALLLRRRPQHSRQRIQAGPRP